MHGQLYMYMHNVHVHAQCTCTVRIIPKLRARTCSYFAGLRLLAIACTVSLKLIILFTPIVKIIRNSNLEQSQMTKYSLTNIEDVGFFV